MSNTTLGTPPAVYRGEFASCGDLTTPWLVIVVGAIARHVLNVVLFLWDKRSKQSEAAVSPEETATLAAADEAQPAADDDEGPGTFMRIVKEALSAYAVVSFVIQFIRDIVYVGSGTEDLSRGWDGYQCTALVVANSPNTKAAWLFLAVLNTEGMYDDDTGFGVFPRLYKYAMILSWAIAMPFYFTHAVPGMVVYCPFYMPLILLWAGTRGIVQSCGARLSKSESAGTALRDGFLYPLIVLLMTACTALSIVMFQTPTGEWKDIWWDNFKSVADDPRRAFDVWRANAEESAGNSFSAAYAVL